MATSCARLYIFEEILSFSEIASLFGFLTVNGQLVRKKRILGQRINIVQISLTETFLIWVDSSTFSVEAKESTFAWEAGGERPLWGGNCRYHRPSGAWQECHRLPRGCCVMEDPPNGICWEWKDCTLLRFLMPRFLDHWLNFTAWAWEQIFIWNLLSVVWQTHSKTQSS